MCRYERCAWGYGEVVAVWLWRADEGVVVTGLGDVAGAARGEFGVEFAEQHSGLAEVHVPPVLRTARTTAPKSGIMRTLVRRREKASCVRYSASEHRDSTGMVRCIHPNDTPRQVWTSGRTAQSRM